MNFNSNNILSVIYEHPELQLLLQFRVFFELRYKFAGVRLSYIYFFIIVAIPLDIKGGTALPICIYVFRYAPRNK